VKSILIAAAIALIASIMLTPYLIKVFSRQGFGQEIREEGPQSHKTKRGTPTMGGVAILVAMWAGYLGSHLVNSMSASAQEQTPSASGLLVLMLTTSLGVVGFLDDFIKIRKQRNLGLNKTAKLVGQFIATIVFAILVMQFPNQDGMTPASVNLSFVRDIAVVSFGVVGFVVFCYAAISAWSNAVNLTDGLDGLAGGTSAMVLGTYVVISFWQFRYNCSNLLVAGCYDVRDPLDLALVAAAAMAGCIGFLWWNAAPAKIFMGDTGSLALGGLVAGLSIATRTELLMVVIGGLFVVEALSVVLQVAVFRSSRRRLFRMAPFHHHFELAGWAETTVIIRFWLLAGMCCMLGLGLFYSEWLTAVES
jgi:phospho-N-acetylmuramoyl-pentapeptide-transferase